MPEEIFKNNFQALIVNTKDGMTIIKTDSAELAMTAFRAWRDDKNDKAQSSYNEALYQSLYEIAQAATTGIPPEEVIGLPTLLLMLEAERTPNLTGIAERYTNKGDMDTEDARIIHARLRKIWNELPDGIKDKLPHPDNVFKIT